ncbi:PhaM family polyhydroxyalkanoate granule multifunctional regulatory protein [Polaromonas sp. JS666]|uniref:PhaM family polyhydroxyalkanoate granule multifunctional regulatory protein n=1 Tax=Polaromonas sp. (strain JS666 / ATCC BAA-500) TaxID=296591 RepID=UPI00004642DB|nr:PhaM family polyhydroxyalkanoate granule multifunctional regulatory protein [Polaromonas sp. JS666]
MSDADNNSFAGFGKLVPGFDFLQNLAKQAADSASQSIPQLPKLGSWVAPTLNVEELDKRIDELKAVQFWLDQNATALKATIQALEVQKMTLATLRGMNFNMGDMANAFKLKVADGVADKAKTFSGLEIPPSAFNGHQANAQASEDTAEKARAKAKAKAKVAAAKSSDATAAAGGVVDPMQWWGALTQQFQTIAADAMKDVARKTAVDTTKNMAAGLAKDAVKTATDMATGLAKGMAESAGKTVAGGARAAMNTALRSAQDWPTPASMASSAAQSPSGPKAKTPARKTARSTVRKTTP